MKLQKQLIFFIAFTLISMLSNTIFSQNNVNWIGAWQYGPADAVFVNYMNEIAYVGAGGAVMIIDVSNPANPELISDDVRTAGFVRDIWYRDDKLYLACGRGGLEIWDIADPQDPLLDSRMDILYAEEPAPVEEIELYNNFAVLMCDWGYVHTVDISDPYNPEQLFFNGQMGNPAHHIYIDTDGVVHSTGAQYYLQLAIGPDGSLNSGGGKEFIYGAGNLYGRENEAFVYYSGNMYILDLTLPGYPAWSITEVSFSDIDVKEDLAYLVNDDGFEIWDVSDLQNPYMMSSVPFMYGNELFISGEYAYVSADHEGLRIIDISDPSNPQLLGQLEAYSWTPAFDISGTTGYVANGSGLYTLDLSNPYGSAPQMLGFLPTAGQLNDVAYSGSMAYLADWTGGLRIIDVSDPANPAEVSTVPIQAWKITAHSDYAFVTEANPNFPDTLKIYDTSDPYTPSMIASYTLPEDAYDVEYADGYLYVACFNSGLRIFDVSNPNSPIEVSWIDLPWVLDVDIEGDMAYIASADWDGGLVSVDIADPENPAILQIYNPSGWFHPFKVGVEWPYAYASDIYGELYVFDISSPTSIQELESLTLPGDILGIHAENGMVFIADAEAGIQILDNTLITGTDEKTNRFSEQKNTTVYPNPATGPVSFDIELPSEGQTQVMIYDIAGRATASILNKSLKKGSYHYVWDTRNEAGKPVPEGIYFYRISNPGLTQTGKIVINR